MHPATEPTNSEQVLPLREVEKIVGIRCTAIYNAIRAGDFPAPLKLTERKSGWLKSEIDDWIERKRQERNERVSSLGR